MHTNEFIWFQGEGIEKSFEGRLKKYESIYAIPKSKIAEYNPENAFKRWLLPGWGSTVLMIECDLMDANELIGSVKARRSIVIGGGYTIGDWKDIFGEVSKDVATNLRKKIDCPKCSK